MEVARTASRINGRQKQSITTQTKLKNVECHAETLENGLTFLQEIEDFSYVSELVPIIYVIVSFLMGSIFPLEKTKPALVVQG